jgi:sugar O-acyltransferase (sialic acid O-acetyltransferase NeuD family)
MSKNIFIYGAGGLGRELGAMLTALPEWTLHGYFDDHVTRGTAIGKVKVLGDANDLLAHEGSIELILAFGDPNTKLTVLKKLLKARAITFPTIIHPAATVYDRNSIYLGKGSVISAGCILTTDIKIGDHVLVNLNCSIGHGSSVGSFSSIMPGVNLAGNVSLQDGSFVGSGAQIINGVTIGEYSRVGAGAVVTKDVRTGATVVGIPAKELS